MNVPDKIYIAETPNKLIEIWSEEPIASNPYITEHEYIRKDALLEWMDKNIKGLNVLFGKIFIAKVKDKLKQL